MLSPEWKEVDTDERTNQRAELIVSELRAGWSVNQVAEESKCGKQPEEDMDRTTVRNMTRILDEKYELTKQTIKLRQIDSKKHER